MNNINQIYCICLDSRKDHMINFFNKMNYNEIKYIKPILGSELEINSVDNLIDKKYISRNYKNLSLGDGSFNYNKLANALSFIKTLKEFILSKNENCLIFEDDLLIPDDSNLQNINSKINKLFSKLQNIKWQYINLGRCWDDSCTYKISYPKDHFKISHCLPVCTHAIIVKRDIAYNLINNTLPLSEQKDNTWRKIIHQDSHWMKYAFCTIPPLFEQDREKLGSNLGNVAKQRECNGSQYSIDNFLKYYKPKIIENFSSLSNNNIYYKNILIIILIIFISIYI